MSKPKTGGPAFPTMLWTERDGVQHGIPHNGVDMRDWFAAHASEEDIQAIIPPTMGKVGEFEKKHGFLPTRQWARYAHADRMIQEREMEVQP